MRAISGTRIALVLVLCSLIVPTGVVLGDDVGEDDWLVLSPHDGPNGRYATVDGDGNLRIDLGDDLNANALISFDNVFTVSNEGPRSAQVWITHEAETTIEFYTSGSDSIVGSPNAIVLSPGETVSVGLTVDTHGTSEGTDLIDGMTVHARWDGPATETEKPNSAARTDELTGTVVDSSRVKIRFDTELYDNEGVRIEQLDGIPADPVDGRLRARATRKTDESDGVADPPASADRLEKLGIDTAVRPGEKFVVSGIESRFPTVASIDSRRRIATAYTITPPRRLVDDAATTWITVDRSRFGGADPSDARLARRTDNGWQLLETFPSDRNTTHIEVQSRTPGFSTFVLFPAPEARFRWTFDGVEPIDGMDAHLVFDDVGIYDGTLLVTDSGGRSDAVSYRVLVNDEPRVRIDRPNRIEPGEPVTLRANVTDEFGDTRVTWEIDDETIATGQTVTHSFSMGEHEVAVHVEDEFGASNESKVQFVVDGRDPIIERIQYTLGVEGQLVLVGLVALLIIGSIRWFKARNKRPGRRTSR